MEIKRECDEGRATHMRARKDTRNKSEREKKKIGARNVLVMVGDSEGTKTA